MKTNKKKELHQQSIAELNKLLGDTRTELTMTRLDHSRGKIKNVRILRSLHTTIAQVNTIIRGKELETHVKNA